MTTSNPKKSPDCAKSGEVVSLTKEHEQDSTTSPDAWLTWVELVKTAKGKHSPARKKKIPALRVRAYRQFG